MSVSAENLFRLGASFFAAALTKIGFDSLRTPRKAAQEFGFPATSEDTLRYIPVFGIRDLGFGSAILSLLAADAAGFIDDGSRAAAIVTAAGACVGLGDSSLVRSSGFKGALTHAAGASAMLFMAIGLWMSARR